MSKAKAGDMVKIHYVGKLGNGKVFDSTRGGDPVEFKIESGEVIIGFLDGILGMSPGEKRTFKVTPERGYGKVREDYIFDISRRKLPTGVIPSVGHNLALTQDDGSTCVVNVLAVSPTLVKIDANHPLAGKELTFEIELLEIE